MMIRKAAVHVAEKFLYLAAETTIQFRRKRACDAVAAIDGNAHRARELHTVSAVDDAA